MHFTSESVSVHVSSDDAFPRPICQHGALAVSNYTVQIAQTELAEP